MEITDRDYIFSTLCNTKTATCNLLSWSHTTLPVFANNKVNAP